MVNIVKEDKFRSLSKRMKAIFYIQTRVSSGQKGNRTIKQLLLLIALGKNTRKS